MKRFRATIYVRDAHAAVGESDRYGVAIKKALEQAPATGDARLVLAEACGDVYYDSLTAHGKTPAEAAEMARAMNSKATRGGGR